MLKKSVLDYFGGPSKTAQFLGLTHVAVIRWEEIIPKGRAYELEKLTKGKLKVDPSLYQKSQNAA
jgi:hypothetical protein